MRVAFRCLGVVVLLSALALVGGCQDDFGASCTLPNRVEEACRHQGGEGSGLTSRVNCVMRENLDCASRLCVVFQDSEPYCSVDCNTDSDCPGAAVCRPFSIFEDSDLYCVPTDKIPAED